MLTTDTTSNASISAEEGEIIEPQPPPSSSNGSYHFCIQPEAKTNHIAPIATKRNYTSMSNSNNTSTITTNHPPILEYFPAITNVTSKPLPQEPPCKRQKTSPNDPSLFPTLTIHSPSEHKSMRDTSNNSNTHSNNPSTDPSDTSKNNESSSPYYTHTHTHSSRRDSSRRDSSPRDSSRRDSSPRDSSRRDRSHDRNKYKHRNKSKNTYHSRNYSRHKSNSDRNHKNYRDRNGHKHRSR
eukprot:101058_1